MNESDPQTKINQTFSNTKMAELFFAEDIAEMEREEAKLEAARNSSENPSQDDQKS